MKKLRTTLSTILLATFVVAGVSYAQAWIGPGSNPPEGNTPAPINVSDELQIKEGPLSIFNNFLASRVDTLDLLTEKFTLVDETSGEGKVLVSNEFGEASWQDVAAVLPACSQDQIIKYNAENSAWECADVESGGVSNGGTGLYRTVSSMVSGYDGSRRMTATLLGEQVSVQPARLIYSNNTIPQYYLADVYGDSIPETTVGGAYEIDGNIMPCSVKLGVAQLPQRATARNLIFKCPYAGVDAVNASNWRLHIDYTQ